MKEIPKNSITEAAVIIRSVLIRILAGKGKDSPISRTGALDISEIHA